MKKHVYHSWKGILVAVVVVVVLGSAAQAFGTAVDSQDVTISATVREPSGMTGTIAFTFALEEVPAASVVMPNYSTLPPQLSAVPPNRPPWCWSALGYWG